MSNLTIPVDFSDLTVEVLDTPGHGGACNEYAFVDSKTGKEVGRLSFQNGPISENGSNGVTNEAVLVALAHRIRGFQSGPYICDENREALEHLNKAQDVLFSRTKKRLDRGVEGTRVL